MLRVGICEQCGFDWDTLAGDLVIQVGQIGARYRGVLRRLEGGGRRVGLRVRPSVGVWSPLEYLAHMRDVARFYLDRIEYVIVEDRPQLATGPGFAALAEDRRYNEIIDVDGVVDDLDRTASVTSARLATLSPEEWGRVGIGGDGDERDVLVLARRLAHEGHHHLLDMTVGDGEVP